MSKEKARSTFTVQALRLALAAIVCKLGKGLKSTALNARLSSVSSAWFKLCFFVCVENYFVLVFFMVKRVNCE